MSEMKQITPGIRLIDSTRITTRVEGTRLEVTDLDGSKRIDWSICCDSCDFYESGLTEGEAFESANGHVCDPG